MSYSADLLTQADGLCAIGPRRPKQANLRRAVSAAYYTLFQQLIEDAVANLLPARLSGLRVRLARKFAHKTMKSVAQATAKEGTTPADLAFVANAFVTLQEARHGADYDFSGPVTKAEASDHIARARDAIARWKLVASTSDGERFMLEILVGRLDAT